jgi:STE24 endopeptidase
MPFLLMLFLVLVCLPEPDVWLPPLWTDAPWLCVAVTWCLILFSSLTAFWLARRGRKVLESEPKLRERVLTRYERARRYYQIVLSAGYLLALLGLGWGWAVGQLWRGSTTFLPGAELLILAPYLVAQLLAWMAYYDVERAAHRIVVDSQAGAWLDLERARAAPSIFNSRISFVLFNLRQKLALALLPVILLVGLKDVQRQFPAMWEAYPKALNFLGIGAVMIVFVILPWIVRLALGFTPLPDGRMRRRLEASARRLGFRCGNILVWNTHNGMANAMVIGIVPWIRYVVFTDRLLADFTPDEIEAVFGHEVGHVRHHHMLYYFSFLTASVTVLCWIVTELVVSFSGFESLGPRDRQIEWLTAIASVLSMLAYILVVFGFLSRRCERQADVFGCRAVSCGSPDCRGHADEAELTRHGEGLCPTGIRTFIQALEKVAFLNGISRDRPGFLQSWQHASIARRVEFLQRIQLDPHLERRFQRRVLLFKCVLLLLLGGAIAFIAFREAKLPTVEANRDDRGAVLQPVP